MYVMRLLVSLLYYVVAVTVYEEYVLDDESEIQEFISVLLLKGSVSILYEAFV